MHPDTRTNTLAKYCKLIRSSSIQAPNHIQTSPIHLQLTMATNDTTTILPIPKLTGYANLAEWDFYLHATLTENGLLKYITETIPRPPASVPFLSFTSPMMDTNIDEVEVWRRDRARCIQILLCSWEDKTISKTLINNGVQLLTVSADLMTPSRLNCTHPSQDPKALYTAMKECFPYTNQQTINSAMEEMERIQQSDFSSLSEFMGRFRFLKRNLNELGVGRSEQAWNLLLVKKLEPSEGEIVSEVLLGTQEERKPLAMPKPGKRKIKELGKKQLGRLEEMVEEIGPGAGKRIKFERGDEL